ncbi:MAG: hypothetical protein AAGF24_00195 [Cyanobacteria bacterium P01_H01_bin.121]
MIRSWDELIKNSNNIWLTHAVVASPIAYHCPPAIEDSFARAIQAQPLSQMAIHDYPFYHRVREAVIRQPSGFQVDRFASEFRRAVRELNG